MITDSAGGRLVQFRPRPGAARPGSGWGSSGGGAGMASNGRRPSPAGIRNAAPGSHPAPARPPAPLAWRGLGVVSPTIFWRGGGGAPPPPAGGILHGSRVASRAGQGLPEFPRGPS
jgi:hypothetical protein